MIAFETIGDEVERRWRAANYHDDVFPDIAMAVLHETAPADHIDPWDVIRWLFTTPRIPQQHDIAGRFGQPPITVYYGPRFYIDVYYWMDGTTAIHQHAFCGAFYVLEGSSIHSQYRFDHRELLNPHFATGELALESVELLQRGDSRPILPGASFIHALFHVDRPSVSICVRTQHSPTGSPQWNYQPPFFAQDPFYQSPDLIKKVQSVDMLLSMNHPDTNALVSALLRDADFQTTFAVLNQLQSARQDAMTKQLGLSRGEERYQAWLETARQRHGQLVDRIEPVLKEAERQQYIKSRRGQVAQPDHRFFLALLLNVPDRAKVLEFVQQRYPSRDPVDCVMEWLEDLTHTQAMGASEANVLGLDDVDDDYLLVMEGMLQNQPIEAIKDMFVEDFSPDYAQQHNDKIEQLYASIRDTQLFRAMFQIPGERAV